MSDMKKLSDLEISQIHSGFAMNMRQPSTVPLLVKSLLLTVNALVDEVTELKKPKSPTKVNTPKPTETI